MRVFTCLLLCVLFSPLPAQDWGPAPAFSPIDWTGGIRFGAPIALDGNQAAVSAVFHSTDAIGANVLGLAGAVYLFERTPAGWQQSQKLTPQDRAPNDFFGSAIDLEGDRLMVGAPQGIPYYVGDTSLFNPGAVYVFEKNSSGQWVEVQKLTASDGRPYDFFGASLDMDDSLAIIGAFGRDPSGPGGQLDTVQGAAYLFELGPDGLWTEIAILTETDTSTQDWYGFEVALQGDLAVVGAPQEDEDSTQSQTLIDPGAVYVYRRQPNGSWPLIQKLVAPDRGWAGEQMGRAICWQGAEMVVSRPGKRVQNSSGAYFNRGGELMLWRLDGDGFFRLDTLLQIADTALANSIYPGLEPGGLAFEGDLILAGGPWIGNRTGEAHLFQRDSTGQWAYRRAFRDPEGSPMDNYGWAVAIDGQELFIGARDKDLHPNPALHRAGRVFAYRPCTPRFTTLLDTLCAGERRWFAGQWLSAPGTYTGRWTAASGCDSTVTLDLYMYPPVQTDLNQTDTTLVALATQASLQWLQCTPDGLVPLPGATGPVLAPDSSGWYALAVEQAGGCRDTSACTELILPLTASVDTWAQGLRIYPNPSRGEVMINFDQAPAPWSCQVYDPQGRLLMTLPFAATPARSLHLPPTPGLYFLHLHDQSGHSAWRQVVKW